MNQKWLNNVISVKNYLAVRPQSFVERNENNHPNNSQVERYLKLYRAKAIRVQVTLEDLSVEVLRQCLLYFNCGIFLYNIWKSNVFLCQYVRSNTAHHSTISIIRTYIVQIWRAKFCYVDYKMCMLPFDCKHLWFVIDSKPSNCKLIKM